ncbi:MAG: asparagine synthase (glutamine-hydrolyzing) [Acidobacteriia bacterium]|nr:asparagine synthase (glutamine-hydrolyzing) [Terriglobia bacterium]
MCGIAGFLTRNASWGRAELERMTEVIAHRGPDGSGHYAQAPAFLGHRRLSIIDVAGGGQPMTNETGTRWIIYNGEIFNHAGIRPALENAGHRYRTRCDTETILHAYEEYGPSCVERFRGMFAFAIWDETEKTLFCARDRLGIKPFYYYWDGALFAFASEIKALLRHPAIAAALDESLLPEYLAFGYTSGDRTLFKGIRKLMPGHHLRLRPDEPESFRIEPYWDARPDPGQPADGDDAYWIRECRRRLEENVEMRLMSDVPLGLFLSGGVDSSAIAALVQRMAAGPVKTFSVGYREAEFSELSYARQVAKTIGTEHHEVVIGMEEFFDALPKLIWHEDEPITWPSSVSLHFLSLLAAKEVKVVLTGEGSDELFAGYNRYRFYQWNRQLRPLYRMMPGVLRERLRASIAHSNLLSAKARRKLRHTILGRGDSVESLYLDNFYSAFSAEEQARLLPGAPAGAAYAAFSRYWDAVAGHSPVGRMLYADQKTYLVELLMKQDQMSMSASIESRVPLLDHTFVEFAAAIPDRMKIRNGEAKYIFKKCVEDLLPHDIIYRRKMGFPTPLRRWLMDGRNAPLLAALRDKDGLLASVIHMPEMETLLRRHQSGEIDASDRIWRLLNLQLWGEIFLTGRRQVDERLVTSV